MSMTREEAIKWLEETIQDTDTYWESCSDALQKELDEQKEVFLVALTALRPVSREQVERMRGVWIPVREIEVTGWDPALAGYDPIGGYVCSQCKEEATLDCNDEFALDNFCPHCGAPITDEAVEMVMEKINNMEEMTNEH